MKNTRSPTPLRSATASGMSDLLKDLELSGLTVAAFARSRDLKPQAIYAALSRRKASAPSELIFDRVQVIGAKPVAAAYEVELSSGRRLLIPDDFDPSTLRCLLEVLGSC